MSTPLFTGPSSPFKEGLNPDYTSTRRVSTEPEPFTRDTTFHEAMTNHSSWDKWLMRRGEGVTPWRKTATFILWQPLSSTRGTTRDRGSTSAMLSHFPTDESRRRGHPSVTTQHHHFIFAIFVTPCLHPGQHNRRGPSPTTKPINHAMMHTSYIRQTTISEEGTPDAEVPEAISTSWTLPSTTTSHSLPPHTLSPVSCIKPTCCAVIVINRLGPVKYYI